MPLGFFLDLVGMKTIGGYPTTLFGFLILPAPAKPMMVVTDVKVKKRKTRNQNVILISGKGSTSRLGPPIAKPQRQFIITQCFGERQKCL